MPLLKLAQQISMLDSVNKILKQLDLLEGMQLFEKEELYIQNLGMQSYWGSEQVHIVDHLRNPVGLSKSLDRKAFEAYLRASAIKRGVQCVWPTKLYRSTFEDHKWNVMTKSDDHKEQHIQATFVIDATGRQSHFAKSLGIKRLHIDKLIACWATLPNKEENKMSTIAATENGWWYSAVVPNNKRILAFQTDSDLIDRSAIKDLDAFIKLSKGNKQINHILENNVDEICFQGTVAANSTRLEHVIGQQWAALGDAAISFDPLSSQGMFNAMASALQLKKLLIASDVIHNSTPAKEAQFQGTYTQQINSIWDQYLYHKNLFYKAEMRWTEHPFWKRRQVRKP
jgi:flavin-dependent dehydrogenase